jgi:hypothetical protein
MATATAMYHSGRNTLRKIHRKAESDDETVDIVRGEKRRRLHKAFLRYHDPANWPLLRETLKAMGRADLVGNGKHHLIPTFQPLNDGAYQSARKKNSTSLAVKPGVAATAKPSGQPAKSAAGSTAKSSNQPIKGRMLTQHTGLPPRVTGAAAKSARKPR